MNNILIDELEKAINKIINEIKIKEIQQDDLIKQYQTLKNIEIDSDEI